MDAAYLYGPWAARYLGAAGPPPRDVEVLVVGAPDHRELADAAGLAERRLGREVNVHCVSVAAWRARGGDPSRPRTTRSSTGRRIDGDRGNFLPADRREESHEP
ncbi:hypothetical protein [Paractinoplanes durhamensis]|uniref:hypothetical protein n=1 Tax=Paractinoplanes durhamensis TaxID=113563 RepID=UPI00363B6565